MSDGVSQPAGGSDVDAASRDEILAWRQGERRRLLAERIALASRLRKGLDDAIADHLDAALGDLRGAVVGVYWPIRAEPNLRRWMARIHARGARCALPVVRERAAPLAFLAWAPGAPMRLGLWSIPQPADAAPVQPDLLVAPMLGFDSSGYRLGYGSGFYDRTLASLLPRPAAVGVAYAAARLASIRPLPHDISMGLVITERGVEVRRSR